MLKSCRFSFFLLVVVSCMLLFLTVDAQPVTGVWRGKITRGSGLRQSTAPVEIKLIASGDSILGTTYYYGKNKSYIRYAIRGYFDPEFSGIHWQDAEMIEMEPANPKGGQSFGESMKASTDFSCPNGTSMFLNGTCELPGMPLMKIDLQKMDKSLFPDEWDEVIEGFFSGMARKEVIDSVWGIAFSRPKQQQQTITVVSPDIAASPKSKNKTTSEILIVPNSTSNSSSLEKDPDIPDYTTITIQNTQPDSLSGLTRENKEKPTAKAVLPPSKLPATPQKPVQGPPIDITAQIAKSNKAADEQASRNNPAPVKPQPPIAQVPQPPVLLTQKSADVSLKTINNPVMEQAFTTRKKVVQKEITVMGDSVELRFYDNAEVDGDSISLFLNGLALFEHVRLDVRPYIFKISVSDLPASSELTMVAENLGSIPPNTAFMEAFVNGTRYTARLESTENSSGVIRLIKKE